VRFKPLATLTLAVATTIVAGSLHAQAPPSPSPAADLDAFMARVLTKRDENWKKLQQYVLEERERLEIVGPDQRRVYGFQREYTWFIRQGLFVRSPLRADGVTIGEGERRRYEAQWVNDEKRREARRAARDKQDQGAATNGTETPAPDAPVEDVVRQGIEPQFVQAAYFLRFKFESGRYGLVGRETVDGIEALRVEYYPEQLFREGRTRPNRRVRERDDQVEEKMNKASLVTLWIAPASHQILKYTFDNVDWDFLPGRSLVRVDAVIASMRMTEAFPSVWLPRDIALRFKMLLALGAVDAQYDVQYHDYKLADVTYKVK
jgi:hypothetical protein